MDTLFYFISIFSFGLGILNISLLIIFHRHSSDNGAWTLILPLAPLTLITFFLILEYYLQYRYLGRSFPVLNLLFEYSRILITFSWNFITIYHYALNGVDRMRWTTVRILAGFSAFLCIVLPFIQFYQPSLMRTVHIIVILLLYFAGIKAIFILKKGRKLLPSTKTALSVAVISLIVYPAIGVGDPLGWRLPFLNPEMSLWIQAHPLYFTLINIPLTLFIFRIIMGERNIYRPPEILREKIEGRLTKREIEVLDLLFQGYTYKEIAKRLFVSLPTVKSHIQHIYRKLDVERREDLFIQYVKQESAGGR